MDFDTFFDTSQQPDSNILQSFLSRINKSMAFKSRLKALGIEINVKDVRSSRFISFKSNALISSKLIRWCGSSNQNLSLGIFNYPNLPFIFILISLSTLTLINNKKSKHTFPSI